MATRRTATRVTLNKAQRERLWFIYGNYGPKTSPGNHQFIQGLLEHGLDLRPLLTKRTAKKDVPTAECVAEVEEVLTSTCGTEDGAARSPVLRLVTPPIREHKIFTPDPELKRMLDEMRRRLSLSRHCGETDAGGKDAA